MLISMPYQRDKFAHYAISLTLEEVYDRDTDEYTGLYQKTLTTYFNGTLQDRKSFPTAVNASDLNEVVDLGSDAACNIGTLEYYELRVYDHGSSEWDIQRLAAPPAPTVASCAKQRTSRAEQVRHVSTLRSSRLH